MKEKHFGYFNHRIIIDEKGIHKIATVYYDENEVPTDYAFTQPFDEDSLYKEIIEQLEAFTRPTLYIKDIDTSRSVLDAAHAYGAGATHYKMEDR